MTDASYHARAGADFIMIPEKPPEAGKWQEQMCEAISRVSFVTLYARFH
jgi:hypothetical protein